MAECDQARWAGPGPDLCVDLLAVLVVFGLHEGVDAIASIMSTNSPDDRRPRRRGVGAERGGEEQQARDEVEHLLEMVQRGAARHGLA
jgi:hypothetical protein